MPVFLSQNRRNIPKAAEIVPFVCEIENKKTHLQKLIIESKRNQPFLPTKNAKTTNNFQ